MSARSVQLAGNLRLIVSLCKSGSTALIHSLSHAPGVTCYLQTVKSGQRTRGEPDYAVFSACHEGVVLSKETIGHSTRADCTLRVFPSDDAVRLTAPVFLFRDPVDTWMSWSRAGWGSPDLFETAYRHALRLYHRARGLNGRSTAIRYEEFAGSPTAAFRSLCEILEIKYTPDMIEWRLRFPDESPVIWGQDVQDDFDRGLSDSARRASGFVYRSTDYTLPQAQADRINRLFRRDYEALPKLRAFSRNRS